MGSSFRNRRVGFETILDVAVIVNVLLSYLCELVASSSILEPTLSFLIRGIGPRAGLLDVSGAIQALTSSKGFGAPGVDPAFSAFSKNHSEISMKKTSRGNQPVQSRLVRLVSLAHLSLPRGT